jgi:heme/copper-type cytochrome/quinol oxidase subunit 4
MEPIDAEEALTYAVSREMVLIYIVILAGAVLQLVGTGFFLPIPDISPVWRLLDFVFTVAGFVAAFVGFIALLYKLIADGAARA